MECCNNHNHEECEEKENKKSEIILYVLSLIIFGIGFVQQFATYKIWIYLVAVLLAGYDLLIKGIKNLFKFNFEESTLMTIAIIGAFVKGEYAESCLVVLLFKLGEFLEDFAERRSNKNIEDITRIKANNANLVEKDEMQLSLFSNEEEEKQEKLDKVVDELKNKYGYSSITRAGKLNSEKNIRLKDV